MNITSVSRFGFSRSSQQNYSKNKIQEQTSSSELKSSSNKMSRGNDVSFKGIWRHKNAPNKPVCSYPLYDNGYSTYHTKVESNSMLEYNPYSWEKTPEVSLAKLEMINTGQGAWLHKQCSISSDDPDFSKREIHERTLSVHSSKPGSLEEYKPNLDLDGKKAVITIGDNEVKFPRLGRRDSLIEQNTDFSIELEILNGRNQNIDSANPKNVPILKKQQANTKEIELLTQKANSGDLIDVSAQNHWKSNEPMFNFLNSIKNNQHDTDWLHKKYVATPYETVPANELILQAHDISNQAIKSLKPEHHESLIKDLIKKDDFVDTVMKHVIKITKVL